MVKSSTLTLPEYIERSTLLLKARPRTTRITTTYHASVKGNDAHFTTKTFDPVSGTCIKYTTDRAAEVGRIMSALGSLGRYMVSSGAQSREDEDVVMEDAPVEQAEVVPPASSSSAPGTGTATPVQATTEAKPKGKKKKGKR
ncbi:hypothetical protein YB2330_000570 [Saitoella coloradoensis]